MLQNIDCRNVKLNINIIVAFCKTRGIGINNNLPWKLKSDMLKFKQLTIGNGNNAVIMGKNTWESIPIKPLPKRHNLILSSSLDIQDNYNGYITKTFNNEDNLMEFIKQNTYENIWIIGGEKIYKLFLEKKIVNNIYLTYINKDYDCDTFLPEIPEIFNLNTLEVDNENGVSLCFKVYVKKSTIS